MKRWLLPICFTLFCSAASGQITVEDVQPMAGTIVFNTIAVTDAEAGFPLAGVTVKVVLAEKDTVFLASNKFGTASFPQRISSDSVKIKLSYLGYKSLEYTHKVSTPWISVSARMSVNPVEIGSIIVQGERIAMIVRGDTTIYNASAFKTMRNDPMSELLKKLPGVEMRDGNLYANGQIVKRILINGTPLFGDYVQRAGELIKSADVEKVKVYDQYSDRDIADGDTLKVKDRVLDVTTKKKMNVVRQTLLSAAAGVYLDKNASGNREELGNMQGQYDRHLAGNNLMAQLGYGDNASYTGMPVSNPGSELCGLLLWDKSGNNRKYQFQSITNFHNKRNSTYSSTVDDYFPTEAYTSRMQTNESMRRDRTTDLKCSNYFSYRIDKRQKIGVGIDFVDYHARLDDRTYSDLRMNDAAAYLSDMQMRNDRDELSVSGKLDYFYNFKKRGRRVKAALSFTHGNGWGKACSIDTLASSTRNLFLTNSRNAGNNHCSGELSYTEPLSKRTSIELRYDIERKKERSERISVDRLTGLPDWNNTCDFTSDYLKHSALANLSYRNGDRINLNIGVWVQSLEQNRDETLPDALRDSRTYTNLLPRLSFVYGGASSKIDLNYHESVSTPSVEQLRGALNTYNAPFYTAGNPSLKETVNRTIGINYTLLDAKTSSSWKLGAKLNFYQNPIVVKEIFFASSAVGPEFGDFEFPAGSTLRIPENASGRFSFNTSASYSTVSKLFRSSVNASVEYAYDRIPYYLYNALNTNDMHRADFTFDVTTDFSRKIEISLSSATGLSYYERDDDSSLKGISEVVGGRIRWNFAKRLWLMTDGRFQFRNTTAPGSLLREVILNASFSCTFGKADEGSIGFDFNDLLNQAKSFIVSMENDCIRMQRMSILGRNMFLKLSYRF